MVQISEADHLKIAEIRDLAADVIASPLDLLREIHARAEQVLESITVLSQPAPYREPKIVAFSEEELRRIYPSRYQG